MKTTTDRPYNQLARYLCASVVAYHLGVSLAHALKKHVPEDVGEFWHVAAESIEREVVNAPHGYPSETDFIATAQNAQPVSPWVN